MATERFANDIQTTLTAAVGAGDSVLPVASGTGFPAQPQFRLRVDDELMIVTGGVGTLNWDVQRGAENSTAAAHAIDAVVVHVLTAGAIGVTSDPAAAVPGLRSLGTAATQAAAGTHTHAAADIASGTMATARLGSGAANSTTYLRGDQTWATVGGTTAQFLFEDYGAVGNGIANDTVAIQAAVTAANAAGGGEAVGSPGKTYKIVDPINILANVMVNLHGSKVVSGLSYAEGPMFRAVGTQTASGVGFESLTATANEGDTWVTVTSGTETEFTDGTWVRIASSELFDGVFPVGEINIAETPTGTCQAMTNVQTTCLTGVSMFTGTAKYGGVFPDSGTIQIDNEQMTYTGKAASGNGVNFTGLTRGVNATTAAAHAQYSVVRLVGPAGRVWLRWPLQGGPYTTSPSIAAMQMVENVGLKNGRLDGGGHGTATTGISFDRCVNARAENLRIDGAENIGVDFVDTVDGVAQNNHITSARRADGLVNLGYGVRVVNASQDITVAHNTIRGCRHASATGSDSRGGVVRRLRYIANSALDTSLDAFDTHSPTDQVEWIGNEIVGCQAGILFNGPRMRAFGNRINHCGTNAINCTNNTLNPTEWEIADNRIYTCVNYGIGIAPTGSVDPVCHFINISDNVVYTPGLSGIRAATGLTNPWKNLSITGNIVSVLASGSSNIGIEVQKADQVVIADNVVANLTTSNVGIKATTVTKSTISGNTVSFGSVTGQGISGVGLIDAAIMGNVVNSATTGIILDAASTNNTVMGNNARGCTTPITDNGSANIKSTADATGAYNRT